MRFARPAVAERLVEQERVDLEQPQPVFAHLRVEPGAGSRHRGLVARAVVQERRICVWGPPVGPARTLGRVAGATEDGAVADIERRAACGERHDVVDGQVTRGVGGTLVARAPVPMLATPGAKHSGAEALPGARAVQGVVAAAVRLPGVLGAATPRGW